MKKGALLLPQKEAVKYKIAMTLTGNETAEFFYSNHYQAREHYFQLTANMAIGGQAIKSINMEEVPA
jgi:hypothetical protein